MTRKSGGLRKLGQSDLWKPVLVAVALIHKFQIKLKEGLYSGFSTDVPIADTAYKQANVEN